MARLDTYHTLVYFIENEIWARGGCTTTAGAKGPTSENKTVERGTLELLSLGLGARAAPLHLHLRDFIDYPSKICIICGQGLGMHSDGRI